MSEPKKITCTVRGTDLVSREPTPYSLGGMMEVWQDVVEQCTTEDKDDDEATGLRPVSISEQQAGEVHIDMARLMRQLYGITGAAARMNQCLWQTADGEKISETVAAHVPASKTARLIRHFIVAHAMLMGALTDTLNDT